MNSDKNTNSTPRLRFPGFTGEWEKKKLGEMANKINRRNHHLEVSRVLTNSANAGVVDQSDYFDRDIAVKENTANYHIVELEDFVYNPRISTAAPVGPISINKVGRGIMSPLYTVFRFHTGYVPFYEQYFQTTIWHPYLKSIANFGARFDRMNITSEGFFNMPLHLPSHAEQMKIAECLAAVDELITAQVQKVGALKERKQGLMQQLFPQSGEAIPRLRFPGFTGVWEEKKLGDSFELLRNNTLSRSQLNYRSGKALNIHYGDVLVNYGEILDVSKEQIPYISDNVTAEQACRETLKNGDVIIADTAEDNTVGKCTEIINIGETPVVSGLHTIPLRPSRVFAPGYLGYYMNSHTYRVGLYPLMQGVKVTSISRSAIQGTNISFPPSLAEQQIIASCLSELDSLITAETMKLDTLRTHKKGLMQQLFPQPSK